MKATSVPKEPRIIAISRLTENTWGHFPFFRAASLIKDLCFLRETFCLPLPDGKSTDSTVLADQCKNRCKSQPSRIAHCVLGMDLHSFETIGRCHFVHMELGTDVPKHSFPLMKPCSYSIPPAREIQQAHSTLPFQDSFC